MLVLDRIYFICKPCLHQPFRCANVRDGSIVRCPVCKQEYRAQIKTDDQGRTSIRAAVVKREAEA